MRLPLFIAGRYLFARKSHNVINIVSLISAVGMAVGTAALIIILSVYNGFDSLVKSMLGAVEPDLAVVPSSGKFFVPDSPVYDSLYRDGRILNMCTVLQDNVFVCYDGQQGTALARGVDSVYEQESPVADCVVSGEFRLHTGERPWAAVGAGFASRMGINVRFSAPLELYCPDKDAVLSVVNPLAGVNSVEIWPSCIVAVNSGVDNNLVILPREVMCSLLGCTDEVSSVELRFTQQTPSKERRRFKKWLAAQLGPDFKVMDRMEQNPQLYKMLRYEKAAVWLIMLFVVLILCFSIFGSLSMLIIEKKEDLGILRSMGASKALVRRSMVLEGWLITLLGMAAGVVSGVGICLLQQYCGIVKMPGNFVVDAYPVLLDWGDVAFSVIMISVLGYLVALIPSSRLKQ